MDSSGNNRYELLFMDDDISDPLDNIVTKPKQQKQVKAAVATGAPNKATSKQNVGEKTTKKPNQSEKENKPSAINKNEANKKSVGSVNDKFNNKQGGASGNGNTNANTNTTGGVNNANRNNKRGGGTDGTQGQVGSGAIRSTSFRQQNGETREQRNNRRNTRENGFNNNYNGPSVTGGENSSQQPRQFRDRENRGPPRGGRNFDGANRGKREFDRQSGSDKTGVKAIDKRDGAGSHNWGSVKEAIDEVNKSDEQVTEKAEESGNEQTEQAPIEEEIKEITLDEWKAQKQQRIKPTFNIRKAGEGEDTSQWKKMIILNNNKKKETESEEELEFDPAMYPQRVGRQQRVLDIQFNFNDGRRGGGGFGGRGRGGRGPRPAGGPGGPNNDRPNVGRFDGAGGRGGSGRGGKRNFGDRHPQNAAPRVNDERQFPTLS